MKIKDLEKKDITETCKKYSNNFMGDCDKNCPFYMFNSWSSRKTTTNCKTNYEYMKKHPDEEVMIECEKPLSIREKLIEILSKYFSIGDSDTYVLTRVKEGFAVGTVTIDDFVEFNEENVADLADYILKSKI